MAHLFLDATEITMVDIGSTRSCEDLAREREAVLMPSLFTHFPGGDGYHNIICLAAPQEPLSDGDVVELPESVDTGTVCRLVRK